VSCVDRCKRAWEAPDAAELGIDLDAGPEEVERSALAATLYGARISAAVASRTYKVLADAGVRTLADADRRGDEKLIAQLDEGGYARYDFRTARKLQTLGAWLREHGDGKVWPLTQGASSSDELAARLQQLPGWGRVTVSVFLRELRVALPRADPPLDPRARAAALHLGLLGQGSSEAEDLSTMRRHARESAVDLRDLEAALIRLTLPHRRAMPACSGGRSCSVLARLEAQRDP
jgi:hypothetical protein